MVDNRLLIRQFRGRVFIIISLKSRSCSSSVCCTVESNLKRLKTDASANLAKDANEWSVQFSKISREQTDLSTTYNRMQRQVNTISEQQTTTAARVDTISRRMANLTIATSEPHKVEHCGWPQCPFGVTRSGFVFVCVQHFGDMEILLDGPRAVKGNVVKMIHHADGPRLSADAFSLVFWIRDDEVRGMWGEGIDRRRRRRRR